uniref:Uncharacterized protein n=1 Tax=Streptomyces sp. FR1 TaxID=349971 RepID=V9Z2G8_9ACTN|nr:hypothetical protein pFRL2_82c [Streptomyces sp. FR1]
MVVDGAGVQAHVAGDPLGGVAEQVTQDDHGELAAGQRQDLLVKAASAAVELQLAADRLEVLGYRAVDEEGRRASVFFEAAGDAAVQHGECLLFEVALLQQFVPASEDLQEHLMDDLFGSASAAEVDLREVVEELLVSQVEALEVEGQIGRGLDGLAVAALLGRYVGGDVAVAHAVLQAVNTGSSPLRPAGPDAGQLACVSAPLGGALRYHPVVFRVLKLTRPPKIVTLRSSP